jgi:hypothetical protein
MLAATATMVFPQSEIINQKSEIFSGLTAARRVYQPQPANAALL